MAKLNEMLKNRITFECFNIFWNNFFIIHFQHNVTDSTARPFMGYPAGFCWLVLKLHHVRSVPHYSPKHTTPHRDKTAQESSDFL